MPREAIVSPYGFKTAQEHYEALLAETTKRGGPSVYTYENFPNAEWNGVYQRPGGAGRRRQPKQLVLGSAHPDLDGAVGADAEVPGVDGAGGLSPGARQRAVALDVLLAGRLHAALVPGGRLGALRHRHAGPRARARGRRAQLHPGHPTSAATSTWKTCRKAACRASAPRCRAGTARRSASGTRTC